MDPITGLILLVAGAAWVDRPSEEEKAEKRAEERRKEQSEYDKAQHQKKKKSGH